MDNKNRPDSPEGQVQWPCSALARSLAEQHDNAIRQAITNHLQHSDWSINDVAPRLKLVKYRDSELATVSMDGEPIYQYGPVEVTTTNEDQKLMMKFTRGYRILNSQQNITN